MSGRTRIAVRGIPKARDASTSGDGAGISPAEVVSQPIDLPQRAPDSGPARTAGEAEARCQAAEAAAEIASGVHALAEAVANSASAAPTARPPTADRRHPLAEQFDAVLRTEWAVFLADSTMPRFGAESDSTLVSFASPAEQGLWRDITLARRMEAALQESEARFEAAFSNAPTATLVASLVDGQTDRFVVVNPALSRLTGFSAVELLGFGFADLEHHDQGRLAADLSTLRPGDENCSEGVRRWVHADGHELLVRIRMAVLPLPGDPAAQLICQIDDVTERLNLAAELRSSEASFRLAFAAAPLPAVLLDLAHGHRGQLFAANPAACAVFGRSDADLRQQDLVSLVHPSQRPAITEMLDALASAERTRYDGTHLYEAAGLTSLRLSAHAVPGPDGFPQHVVAFFQDSAPGTVPMPSPRPEAWRLSATTPKQGRQHHW